jgi:hypothetical protein
MRQIKTCKKVSPEYEKFENLDVYVPARWWQALSCFEGSNLGIVAIVVLNVYGRVEVDSRYSIIGIVVLGLVSVLNLRVDNGSYYKEKSESSDEHGNV